MKFMIILMQLHLAMSFYEVSNIKTKFLMQPSTEKRAASKIAMAYYITFIVHLLRMR